MAGVSIEYVLKEIERMTDKDVVHDIAETVEVIADSIRLYFESGGQYDLLAELIIRRIHQDWKLRPNVLKHLPPHLREEYIESTKLHEYGSSMTCNYCGVCVEHVALLQRCPKRG